MPKYAECEHAGIDPRIIRRFERRIERLLADMDEYNLRLFCGSTGTIRMFGEDGKRDLILGHFFGANHDGGCGAALQDEDGLLRGE